MTKHLVAYAVALCLFTATVPAHASTCTQVDGTGEATDSACLESPIGLCVDGTIDGSFVGTYAGVFQTLRPAPRPFRPLRFTFTLTSEIATSSGSIQQTESGVLLMTDSVAAAACVAACTSDTCLASCVLTHGRSTFRQRMTPVSGTGAYANVVGGLIVTSGYGDPTTGVSYVTYDGEICE